MNAAMSALAIAGCLALVFVVAFALGTVVLVGVWLMGAE